MNYFTKFCPAPRGSVGRPRVRETDELVLLGLVDGLLWRKHKVRSAMPLFTLCVLGAVDAIMRCSFLR